MTDMNGWSRSELHVMKELERLSGEIHTLGEKIDCVDKKLGNLRVEVAHKGAIWGALSAAVIAGLGWLVRR